MDAGTQAALARALSAGIASRSLEAPRDATSSQSPRVTQLWAYDHNTDVPSYPAAVLAAAGDDVAAVAWHCYAADATGWGVLSDFHESHAGVLQVMSECWTHLKDSTFFDLADFVHGPMQNWAVGAVAWTLGGSARYDVSYPGGCGECSGLVQVDNSSGTYELTRDFYTLGQFSRFVRKGAVVLNGSSSSSSSSAAPLASPPLLQTTHYINPGGSRIVVFSHKSPIASLAQIDFASGDSWWGTLPARSVVTWVLPPAERVAAGAGAAAAAAAAASGS